jgi:hypothetical protein
LKSPHAEPERNVVETAIETERAVTEMRVADPEIAIKRESFRVVGEEEIPIKEEEGGKEAEAPGMMGVALGKIPEVVEEGEKSRSSAGCFRHLSRKYH